MVIFGCLVIFKSEAFKKLTESSGCGAAPAVYKIGRESARHVVGVTDVSSSAGGCPQEGIPQSRPGAVGRAESSRYSV